MTQIKRPHRLYRHTRSTLVGIGTAVALVILFTSVLHARVATKDTTPIKRALPVTTTQYQKEDSYSREVSYLGLVKASRGTDMAFEAPGLLVTQTAREGTQVEVGEILASLDNSAVLARKKATLAEQQRVASELELAKIKAVRQQNLRDSGAVSREAYDETRLRAQALEAQSDAVAAQLDSINIELAKTVLHAPYTGVIAERFADIGTVVAAGGPILRIVETGHTEAHIGVAVEPLGRMKIGEHYPLMVRGERVMAPLLAVRPDVNPVTRTVTALFQLPSGGGTLHGEPVTLKLDQSVSMTGGWLPLTALLEGERGTWTVLKVSRVGPQLSTVREMVEVVEVQGNSAYVRGTIVDGDIVVANGVHKVTPGTAVVQAQVI